MGKSVMGLKEGLGDMVTLEAFKVGDAQILLPSCASRVVRWSLICMGVIAALDSPLRRSFESQLRWDYVQDAVHLMPDQIHPVNEDGCDLFYKCYSFFELYG